MFFDEIWFVRVGVWKFCFVYFVDIFDGEDGQAKPITAYDI